MRRRSIRNWAQEVLDLDRQPYVPPVTRDTPGLIDAVAALLLAAIGVPPVVRSIESEGMDEQ